MVVQIETRRFATAAIPPKDQPPLPVDADRMETREIAAQLLEMIAGRHAQALVGRRVVDHLELPKETAFEIGRMFRGSGGGPIFGLQSRHTSELPGVRRYKHRAPAACLGGDQEIVRPDRRSRPPPRRLPARKAAPRPAPAGRPRGGPCFPCAGRCWRRRIATRTGRWWRAPACLAEARARTVREDVRAAASGP